MFLISLEQTNLVTSQSQSLVNVMGFTTVIKTNELEHYVCALCMLQDLCTLFDVLPHRTSRRAWPIVQIVK